MAFKGCCGADGIHRDTVLPLNGRLADTKRFAIDYMRLDDDGRLVSGDPAAVESYSDYGAEVLAVADATVVATLDSRRPGPRLATRTVDHHAGEDDGNYVVVDLGAGRYAFDAHLKKGSVPVAPGAPGGGPVPAGQQRAHPGAAPALPPHGWDLRARLQRFAGQVARPRKALGEDNLPVIRLHDLPHSHATLLLADRVPVTVVSERLAHASATITLSVYQHVHPGIGREAAERLAALLGS